MPEQPKAANPQPLGTIWAHGGWRSTDHCRLRPRGGFAIGVCPSVSTGLLVLRRYLLASDMEVGRPAGIDIELSYSVEGFHSFVRDFGCNSVASGRQIDVDGSSILDDKVTFSWTTQIKVKLVAGCVLNGQAGTLASCDRRLDRLRKFLMCSRSYLVNVRLD